MASAWDAFEACPERFQAAHKRGLIAGTSLDLLLAHHGDVGERLRLVMNGSIQASARHAADRAARLVLLADAMDQDRVNESANAHALIAESLAVLRPSDEIEVLIVPGPEPGPASTLIPGEDAGVLIVWDGRDLSLQTARLEGISLHEAAHAQPEVIRQSQSIRAERRREAEIWADVLAMSMGGPGYAGCFVQLQVDSGRAVDYVGPTHPSFAWRAHSMREEMKQLWTPEFRERVADLLSPLEAPLPENEARAAERGQEGIMPFRRTVSKHQIQPEDVYAAARGVSPERQCVRLAAAHLGGTGHVGA